MIAFLNKPYPYDAFSLKEIRENFFIGLFIFLFLLIFKPFGINEWETDHKILKLLGFGFVSFLGPTLVQLVLSFFSSSSEWEDSWKVWKEILIIVIIIVLIALGNLVLANFYEIGSFNISEFIRILTLTCLVGLFPVVVTIALKHQRFQSMNKKRAEEIDKEIEKREARKKETLVTEKSTSRLQFIADNNKDILEIFLQQLLYVESADNYCNIVFLSENKIQKKMLRGSLKRFESQITESSVIRCHRSYLVNIFNVVRIAGNAQGYRLSFKNSEITLPVSRNYGKAILERLRSGN
jgi:hypothetical protein